MRLDRPPCRVAQLLQGTRVACRDRFRHQRLACRGKLPEMDKIVRPLGPLRRVVSARYPTTGTLRAGARLLQQRDPLAGRELCETPLQLLLWNAAPAHWTVQKHP